MISKLLRDGEPAAAELVQRLPRLLNTVAGYIERDSSRIEADPVASEALYHLWRLAETVEMHMKFIEASDRLLKDLPELEQRYGGPRPTGRYEANAGTFVYVAYDIHGTVIYVGITDDLFGRMAAHRSSGRWWPEMERLEWEEWPDRESAGAKERKLIARHRPRFNTQSNPDARGGS